MTKLGSRKLHICLKVTKMGSIIGHRIDYNGVGAMRGLKGQRHIPTPPAKTPNKTCIYVCMEKTCPR